MIRKPLPIAVGFAFLAAVVGLVPDVEIVMASTDPSITPESAQTGEVAAPEAAAAPAPTPSAAEAARARARSWGPTALVRLTVHFENGSFQLVRQRSMVSVLPAFSELPAQVGRVSGFWYELVDADGLLVYRRAISDPVVVRSERAAGAQGALESTAWIPPSRDFDILLPALLPGDRLVIYSSTRYAQDLAQGVRSISAGPAEVVASLSLDSVADNGGAR